MNRIAASLLLVFHLALFSWAQAKPATVAHAEKTPQPMLPSEETINGFLHYTFGYDPGITWKISSVKPSMGMAEVTVVLAKQGQQQVTKFLVTPDDQHVVVGEIIPFGSKPFETTRRLLAEGARGPSRGPAASPVTIVEFSDFQCPHCKNAQPKIEKVLADHPDVRFIFQNFPLEMHDWARKAAQYAECIGQVNPDAFFKFVHETFEQQANITASTADEKLKAIADGAGVKGAEIAACAAKPQTDTAVEKSYKLGQAADVASTPTFFINGRKIQNLIEMPDELIGQFIEFFAKDAKAGK
jgi:protein-disulfide isomerase